MVTKLKKNLFYNIAYQLLNIALPLITVPYISRTLGVESNGIYSYTYSIANYFMIFAMLGISNYGNRRIAKVRDDKKKLSSEFTSIFVVQMTLSLISIAAYLVYCFFVAQYQTISYIEVLFLISTMLDISWLYFGLEDFKTTVTRNSVIKVLSVIFILLFIHNYNDVNKYALIMSGSTLLSQLVLWLGVKKRVNISLSNTTFKKAHSHFKGILILFIPVISYSIYKIMDKIMLGLMYSVDEVAFYEYAERVINIPIGIVTAIGTVMLPKISNMTSKHKTEHVTRYLYMALEIISFMAIPCCLGLIVISDNLSTLFLGDAYIRTGAIMKLLSITFLFTAWANVVRTQWLIPNEKDNIYIFTTAIGALVNFIINILLIPKYGGVGAAIGTIFSEFLIMFSQSFLSRKSIQFQNVFRQTAYFLFNGIVMMLIILPIQYLNIDKPLVLSSQIIIGATIYGALNVKFIKKHIMPRNNHLEEK